MRTFFRKSLTLFILLCLIPMETSAAKNPFLTPLTTPYRSFPFPKIKHAHYLPAFDEGMRRQKTEIDAIVSNPEAPTFDNTIVALERSGALLDEVSAVFSNLELADSDDELQKISLDITPRLTAHSNDITLNPDLFRRIEAVYRSRDSLHLSTADMRLLTRTYDSFIRSGAGLSEADRQTFRTLSEELSTLTQQFGQNVLKATAAYTLHLTDPADLAGLPDDVVKAARAAADERSLPGWVFTLHAPSYVPFMKYATRRDLRERLYRAYNTKCTDGDFDNRPLVSRITALRLQIARLLGYTDYADYVLRNRMAERESNVRDLLDRLLEAYRTPARAEVDDIRAFARAAEGADFELMPWDFSFYAERLKQQRFDISDEVLKPYFPLPQVKEAVFGLANTLYGLTFKENPHIPVYHKDVQCYEVYDADRFMGLLYVDFFSRNSKQGGAWMTEFRSQYHAPDGSDIRPHISLVMNFARPHGSTPSLLTYDQVTTFLHEFGHALHGLLSECRYESQGGTNVYRDFVELPSQLMENFASSPRFLATCARHYKTGEPLPEALMQKVKSAERFNVAYACLRQLSFGYLDMAWHSLDAPYEGDVLAFEREAWTSTRLLPDVEGTCMSVNFTHIFSGGYAAGYYGYKWAEVLDADAFYNVFEVLGWHEAALRFRREILSRGSTDHPATLYRNFRGGEPSIDGLLTRDGLTAPRP